MKSRKLIFVVGPTASGKTDYALREAKRLEAAILSCDSLCVYRGMNIGTAKPSEGEQETIAHYGIDLADPEEPYSVGAFMHYRDGVLEKHWQSGQPLLVVGGSGFYLKSFFSPVTDELMIPDAIRAEVETVRKSGGLAGLDKALRAANPEGEPFPGLDFRNPRRLEKALARCLASGESYSQLRQKFEAMPDPLPQWDKEVILVSRSSEDLAKRNHLRVHSMLEAGLIEEVRELRRLGFERNPSACRAIGYRETLQYLDGQIEEKELAAEIILHTNQLMRKQRTWFRRQTPVHQQIQL